MLKDELLKNIGKTMNVKSYHEYESIKLVDVYYDENYYETWLAKFDLGICGLEIKVDNIKSIEILDQSNCKRKIKMISREEMIKADGKYVNIDYKNGEKLKNVYVIEYLDAESEEEENSLELDKILVLQSEIEKIEILDQEQL